MDPQACLQRIFDAMANSDREEFESAMVDLGHWLKRGGFAPKCNSLGMAQRKFMHGRTDNYRRTLICGQPTPFSIQCVDADSNGKPPYELVEYSPRGELLNRWQLAHD